MATYDLRKKTFDKKTGNLISTGQKITPLNGGTDPAFINRVQNLEQKVSEQSDKLDRLLNLLQNNGRQV